MLVLTRKYGERIHIGDDIVVTIRKTGTTVKVGVDAPKDMKILRGEIVDQKRKPAA